MGRHDGPSGDRIRRQRAPPIESKPSKPQQSGSQQGERQIVGGHILGSVSASSSQHERTGQRARSGADMHDRPARKIQGPQPPQPAAAPDPMGQRAVDEDGPQDRKQHERTEPHALGKGAGDQCRCKRREHELEHHERHMRDGGTVAWIRVSPHAAQPCPSQSSYDPAAIGSEDQTVSKEDPNQADETENDDAVHDGAQRVLGPHEPPVKEGQARHDHGEYEGGRCQHPGGVPAVDSRRDRRRRRPLRPRASCPEGTPHPGRKDGDPVPRYGRHNALLVKIVEP